METADIRAIEKFIARFRRFDEEAYRWHVDRFCAEFRRFQVGFECALAQAAENRRLTASTFNIFEVLRRSYDEVGTHSALLANLLDPLGSHGQGTLFLQSFLLRHSYAFSAQIPLAGQLTNADWSVKTECPIHDGALDIVVASPQLRCLLVIENKLLAGEQPDQLLRYGQWLDTQSQYTHRALFYLTPDGRKSNTAGDALYYPLSYRTDIIPWLEQAMTAVEAPRLVDLFQQYLDVLHKL